ncbi:MAG: 50S ribosomal protein L11 methyltransferase [Myxococcaceae bacterium]|jgi:ribosomal protein L11 methyltransferase|nr:50S ribosomal protein L11 methyltransferase [Myxococcaceae bacterium]
MSWVSVTVDVSEADSEWVQTLLTEAGAAGLEVRDASTPPMPGVRRPSAGEAIVIGYFEQAADADDALGTVRDEVPGARAVVEGVVEQDWSVAWRERIKSVTVGRLWVGPPWEKATAPADKVCLFIEPKMAFGTGDHPTTSLCLAAVDSYLASHPGCSVLDVGTGTGVLAFAAKKLGSGRTVGTDNDPVAIELAKECAEENGLSGVELSTKTLDEVEGTFDFVLANILANTLIALAPLIAPKVKHRLVMAGVLVPQADEVRRAYVAQGLVSAGDVVEGEWIRLDLVHPGA